MIAGRSLSAEASPARPKSFTESYSFPTPSSMHGDVDRLFKDHSRSILGLNGKPMSAHSHGNAGVQCASALGERGDAININLHEGNSD